MREAAEQLEELLLRLEESLAGSLRRDFVQAALDRGSKAALARLRSAFAAHSFQTPGPSLDVGKLVRALDRRTWEDGFRVLHSWDHSEHRFTDDVTPVLLLDFFEGQAPPERVDATALAILVDYHFLHLLALCAMRAWDAPDPDAVLTRVTAALGTLQGDGGAGHHFVSDAEMLLMYALSQFHPEEHAYDRFAERAESLQPDSRVRFFALSAAVLSSHLRWGFWLMYGRDVVRMRRDNVGDYPWLLHSVATLMRAYDDDVAAGRDVSAGLLHPLLLGLAADPWALTGKPPEALRPVSELHEEVGGLLRRHASSLIEALEAVRPTRAAYAPLALHYNFPHNALVEAAALALLTGEPRPMPLDALFEPDEPGESADSGESEAPPMSAREEFARALTAFSGASPDRLGARGALLIAYDPLTAMRTFTMTRKAIQELVSA